MQTLEQMKATLEEIQARKPKRPSLRYKALYVIEVLAGGDFDQNETGLSAIYKFAHVALGTCPNPHDDWREELEETYRGFIKGGL